MQDLSFFGIKRKALTVAVGIVSAGLSSMSLAQTENEAQEAAVETEAIVVVGQATAGLDTLITAEEISKKQNHDLADLFRGNAEIAAGGSVGMAQKIYLRGIGEDSLHISVDGAEQAGAIFHHAARVSVEPELLKQVEIEAGAGSATVGPGALGGSVRFVTKDPEDLLRDGKDAGGLVKTSYLSNGDGHRVSTSLFGQTESGNVGGLISIIKTGKDNVDDGHGNELEGTELKERIGFFKLVGKPSADQKISVSIENLTENGDMSYRPEWQPTGSSPVGETTGDRKTSILNYEFKPENSEAVDLSVNTFQTKYRQTREWPGFGNYWGDVETKGVNIQNKTQIANHELIYGINYRDDEVYQNVDGNEYEEDGSVTGFYVQDIYEATEDLTLSAGVRYDDYELNDVNGLKIDDSGVSPNVSANYALFDSLSLSAGYAKAFRGPEVKDAFRLESYTNDPNLKGEEATNIEFGVNIDIADTNTSIALGAYDSKIENPIAGLLPWSSDYVNLEQDIETKGYTLGIDQVLGDLTINATANIADNEMDNATIIRYTHSSSANSLGDTLTLNLDYYLSESISFGWTSELVDGIRDINLNIGGDDIVVNKPGYSVHDVYVNWTPLQDDSLTLGLAVNNVFDKSYVSHASLEDLSNNTGWEVINPSDDAGRDIRVTAAYQF